jgi:hypothetical protein
MYHVPKYPNVLILYRNLLIKTKLFTFAANYGADELIPEGELNVSLDMLFT